MCTVDVISLVEYLNIDIKSQVTLDEDKTEIMTIACNEIEQINDRTIYADGVSLCFGEIIVEIRNR